MRCNYCDFHDEKSKDNHFSDYPRQKLNKQILEHAVDLFKYNKPWSINLCGNGETTILNDWTKIGELFLPLTDKLWINSNFAKKFNEKELTFLAKLSNISISIDTADEELLRKIRKPVELSTIILNINRIKTQAALLSINAPVFKINCTVTTLNYREFSNLMALAASLGINNVQFSNLHPTCKSKSNNIHPISFLNDYELREAINDFQKAKEIAKEYDIKINFTSNEIRNLLNGFSENNINLNYISSKTMTVMCFQPWNGFWINGDGHISYCCRHMAVTDKDITKFSNTLDIMNHRTVLELRRSLLNGDVPEKCSNCELGKPVTVTNFKRALSFRNNKFSKLLFRGIGLLKRLF